MHPQPISGYPFDWHPSKINAIKDFMVSQKIRKAAFLRE